MRLRHRHRHEQARHQSASSDEDTVIGHYDAAVEGRLLTWMPNSPASSMINRLFRKRPAAPHRDVHYGEREDPEIGPPI